MTKYYGIWNTKEKRWWGMDWYCGGSVVFKKETKMINNIPIWDSRNTIELRFGLGNWSARFWEIKEFTPIDALLVKCGKSGKENNGQI